MKRTHRINDAEVMLSDGMRLDYDCVEVNVRDRVVYVVEGNKSIRGILPFENVNRIIKL